MQFWGDGPERREDHGHGESGELPGCRDGKWDDGQRDSEFDLDDVAAGDDLLEGGADVAGDGGISDPFGPWRDPEVGQDGVRAGGRGEDPTPYHSGHDE